MKKEYKELKEKIDRAEMIIEFSEIRIKVLKDSLTKLKSLVSKDQVLKWERELNSATLANLRLKSYLKNRIFELYAEV